MSPLRWAAVVLIVAGVLGLAYGGFSYTREMHHAEFGPMHMTIMGRQMVHVPIWIGTGAIVAGVLMLVVGRRR